MSHTLSKIHTALCNVEDIYVAANFVERLPHDGFQAPAVTLMQVRDDMGEMFCIKLFFDQTGTYLLHQVMEVRVSGGSEYYDLRIRHSIPHSWLISPITRRFFERP